MTITPSLSGFFYSLLFGALVLGALGAGFIILSQRDKVVRR
ncbi:MAG: Photosystem II reaction center X protein [Acaryochloridaceae cyanobacterium SU_2_1]|nr:Photosystem II reaction center X protein [Acaryochloridaceae cyanobacterium SU_2_1]